METFIIDLENTKVFKEDGTEIPMIYELKILPGRRVEIKGFIKDPTCKDKVPLFGPKKLHLSKKGIKGFLKSLLKGYLETEFIYFKEPIRFKKKGLYINYKELVNQL
mgnify:CR=1 FL=1